MPVDLGLTRRKHRGRARLLAGVADDSTITGQTIAARPIDQTRWVRKVGQLSALNSAGSSGPRNATPEQRGSTPTLPAWARDCSIDLPSRGAMRDRSRDRRRQRRRGTTHAAGRRVLRKSVDRTKLGMRVSAILATAVPHESRRALGRTTKACARSPGRQVTRSLAPPLPAGPLFGSLVRV